MTKDILKETPLDEVQIVVNHFYGDYKDEVSKDDIRRALNTCTGQCIILNCRMKKLYNEVIRELPLPKRLKSFLVKL